MAVAVEGNEPPAPVGEGGHGRFGVAALLGGQAQLIGAAAAEPGAEEPEAAGAATARTRGALGEEKTWPS